RATGPAPQEGWWSVNGDSIRPTGEIAAPLRQGKRHAHNPLWRFLASRDEGGGAQAAAVALHSEQDAEQNQECIGPRPFGLRAIEAEINVQDQHGTDCRARANEQAEKQ